MIRVEQLVKTFKAKGESVIAVNAIAFEIGAGEIVTLLGPSGCGKTTTLRAIAGLERPDSGRISIGERTVVDTERGVFVPAHRRNLGMVFQSYAIWPHMSVLENVAYALEGRRLGRSEMKARAMAALDTVQLTHLADRPAPRLSGGQQQRVAIARALVGNPQALLFDEPLSNLDARLRTEMRNELKRLQKQIGLTSIYVTHDQAEALALSDWIIVMKDGRIIERGRPAQIYRTPRHVFTAQFVGTTNLIPGRVEEIGEGGHVISVTTSIGRLFGTNPGNDLAVGQRVMVSIRPEDMIVQERETAFGGPMSNILSATLTLAVFAGKLIEAEARCGDINVQCLLPRDGDLTPGSKVVLRAPAEACLVLPDAVR